MEGEGVERGSLQPPTSLDLNEPNSGGSPSAQSPPPSNILLGPQPLHSPTGGPGSPFGHPESPLFSSSEELVRSLRDDQFNNDTIEVCSRFFQRQSSRPKRRSKKASSGERQRNREGLKSTTTSSSGDARQGSRKGSMEDPELAKARERLLKFSVQLNSLKKPPQDRPGAHAKQSSDTSAATSQPNTLRGNYRFNSDISNESKVLEVKHARAKSDPIVNRVNNTKSATVEVHAVRNSGERSNEVGSSTPTRSSTIVPAAPSRSQRRVFSFTRNHSYAAVNHNSIVQPPPTASSTGFSHFSFGSRTSVHSDDSKFKKMLNQWKLFRKNKVKKKEDKQSKKKVGAPLIEVMGGTEGNGSSGSNPASLTRQNSLSSKIKNLVAGYVAEDEEGRLEARKEEARKKRLKKRSVLDSSREPSISQTDDKDTGPSSNRGQSSSAMHQSQSLHSLQHRKLLHDQMPQRSLVVTEVAQSQYLRSSHLSVDGVQANESDDVFTSASAAPSSSNLLGTSVDPVRPSRVRGGRQEWSENVEGASAPLARFDSAIDDESMDRAGSSTSTQQGHHNNTSFTNTSGIVSGNSHSTPPPVADVSVVEPSTELGAVGGADTREDSHGGEDKHKKYDRIADRLCEIAQQPVVVEAVKHITQDPLVYMDQMVADGELLVPDDRDGPVTSADENAKRMRKFSEQLLRMPFPVLPFSQTAQNVPAVPHVFERLRNSAYEEFRAIINSLLMRPDNTTTPSSSASRTQPPNFPQPCSSTAQRTSSTTAHDSNNNQIVSTQSLFTAFLNMIGSVVQVSDEPSAQLAANVILYINQYFRSNLEDAGGYESVFSDAPSTDDNLNADVD